MGQGWGTTQCKEKGLAKESKKEKEINKMKVRKGFNIKFKKGFGPHFHKGYCKPIKRKRFPAGF